MPSISQRQQQLVALLQDGPWQASATSGESPRYLRGGRPSIDVTLAALTADGTATWQLDVRLPDSWPTRRLGAGPDAIPAVVEHLRAILESDPVYTIGAGAPGPGDISWRQVVTESAPLAPANPLRILRNLAPVADSGGFVSAGRTDLGAVVLQPGPWEPGFHALVSGGDGVVDVARVLALQPTVVLEEPLPQRLDAGWSLWSASSLLTLDAWSQLKVGACLGSRQRINMQDRTIRVYTEGDEQLSVLVRMTVTPGDGTLLEEVTNPTNPPGRYLLSGPDRRPWSLLRTRMEMQEGVEGTLELVLEGEGPRAAALDPFSAGGLE